MLNIISEYAQERHDAGLRCRVCRMAREAYEGLREDLQCNDEESFLSSGREAIYVVGEWGEMECILDRRLRDFDCVILGSKREPLPVELTN